MTITIGDGAGAWPRIYARYARAGRTIRDGDSATAQGVSRNAGATNWCLANMSRQAVAELWATPFSFAGAGVLPLDQADGARWWMPVSPPWSKVEVLVLCQSSPGVNDSDITFYSRSAWETLTIAAPGSLTWRPLDGTDIAVSDSGVEEYYMEISPGAGETVKIYGLAISEICRTSL